MPRVVRVDQSDYRLKVQQGGLIVLDTGENIGWVEITGNLRVRGETTTVETTELQIEDNIIILNKGELGPGISDPGGTSGIEIDRGPDQYGSDSANAQLLFNENVTFWDPTVEANVPGSFVFQLKSGKLVGIKAASIIGNADVNFTFDMQDGDKVLSIVNSLNGEYERYLNFDDDIPNLKWVQKYVAASGYDPNNPDSQGRAEVEKFFYTDPGTQSIKSRGQAYSDRIEFFINEQSAAKISIFGLDVDDVNIKDYIITSTGSSNLVLTADNGTVEIRNTLNIADRVSDPTLDTGNTLIYSKSQQVLLSQTPGRTGIFFTNTVNSDELVAKNRALLFSMIF